VACDGMGSMASPPTDTLAATSGDDVMGAPRRRGKSKDPNFTYDGPVAVIRLELDGCDDRVRRRLERQWEAVFRLRRALQRDAAARCRAYWAASHGELGEPRIAASVEFARRPLAVPPEPLRFVPLPIHRAYGFLLPTLPVVAEAEACAEKLARYRRVALARDLYDLNHFATRSFDEALVRRLWVLKVWANVIDDRRGNRPLRPEDILTVRSEQDFERDSIGVLTRPVDIPDWEARVRRRFAFLTDLDVNEQRWASATNATDRKCKTRSARCAVDPAAPTGRARSTGCRAAYCRQNCRQKTNRGPSTMPEGPLSCVRPKRFELPTF
jgi:uncharacterized protein